MTRIFGPTIRIPDAPGQAQIQSDLFYDYARTSMLIQSGRRGYRRRSQSFWSYGQARLSFDPASGTLRKTTNAEVYVLDAGHFALDTKADEIATLVREFMKTQK